MPPLDANNSPIFMPHAWRGYEVPIGGRLCRPFQLVVASVYPAIVNADQAEPVALTMWGQYYDRGVGKVFLLHGGMKPLPLYGKSMEDLSSDELGDCVRRGAPHLGAIDWIAYHCRRLRANMLLIEGNAAGRSAAQEVSRRCSDVDLAIRFVPPDANGLRARALSVRPLLDSGIVEVPVSAVDDTNVAPRDWAQSIIDECFSFRGLTADRIAAVGSVTQALCFMRDLGLIAAGHEAHGAP